jgi:hypothetical protein
MVADRAYDEAMEAIANTEKSLLDKQVGLKYDSDKPNMSLLSSLAIEELSKVLTFGAKKYSDHNWRKGISTSRLLAAAFRHLFAYLRGEDLDPETGLSHVAHAMCCMMFIIELKITDPKSDDRYVVVPKVDAVNVPSNTRNAF